VTNCPLDTHEGWSRGVRFQPSKLVLLSSPARQVKPCESPDGTASQADSGNPLSSAALSGDACNDTFGRRRSKSLGRGEGRSYPLQARLIMPIRAQIVIPVGVSADQKVMVVGL